MLVLWHDDQKSRPGKTASVECLQALQNLNRSCRVQVSSDTAIYQVGAAIKKPLFQLIIHVGGICRKLQLLTSNNLSLEVYSGNIHSRAQCWESQWKTYIHDQCRAAPAIWLSQALSPVLPHWGPGPACPGLVWQRHEFGMCPWVQIIAVTSFHLATFCCFSTFSRHLDCELALDQWSWFWKPVG